MTTVEAAVVDAPAAGRPHPAGAACSAACCEPRSP